jgi:hypothetical protein
MPLQWNAALNDLIALLAGLYPEADKARFVVRRAGLDPYESDITGTPKIFWMRIIEDANRRDAVQKLVDVAKAEFQNINFDSLEQQLRTPSASAMPRLDENAWKGLATTTGSMERVIGSQPTFLPISFLEKGLDRARSVVRVANTLGLGTGFLVRDNLLVTNNHVIPNLEVAQGTKIWFNYQTTMNDSEAKVEELTLDPNAGFATSPYQGGDDWTAVRVKGAPNASWGKIDLIDTSIKVNDYVNIVQHPGGMPKQIALYHNMVAYADDRRIQYLTDTMPGSSGSPVFDSEWRIVALHHSGGWLPEPSTNKVFFRNEGIHIRVVIAGLKGHGILNE